MSWLLGLFLLASAGYVSAQSVGLYVGAGTATNSAAKINNPTPLCPSGNYFDQTTGSCQAAPTMGGWFGAFGADLMLTPHLGFNGQYAFRLAQAPYLPEAHLNYRPSFYDFNAVWEPVSGKRIAPVLEGGIGGVKLTVYLTQVTSTTGMVLAANIIDGSVNYFQLHGAAGVKLYLRGNIFIKPQFDLRYVPHLERQFGRSVVPQYTVFIGHTWGAR